MPTTIRFNFPSTTDGGLNLSDLSESAFGDDRECLVELVKTAALLCADLHHAASLFLQTTNQLAFVNRQRERLFTVGIFASPHRFDQNFCMPMIGRGNLDDVDIVA